MDISFEEYQKAKRIVMQYEWSLQPKTKQVSVVYDAEVRATVQVPEDMTSEEIIEAMKDGYYDFDLEDAAETEIKLMKELIVDGYEVEFKS